MTDFAQNLYEARRLRRLSRADLGHRIGVSSETIRRWEAGYNEPRTADVAHQIDVVLGTAFEADLFGQVTYDEPLPADDMGAVLAELRRLRGDLDDLRSSIGARPHRRAAGPSRRGFRPSDSTSFPPLSTPHDQVAV